MGFNLKVITKDVKVGINRNYKVILFKLIIIVYVDHVHTWYDNKYVPWTDQMYVCTPHGATL